MTTNQTLKYSREYTPYSRERLIEKIQEALSKKRFQHVLAVEKAALYLAEMYHLDIEKVSIAALLHDIAKERPDEEMRDIIISENLDLEMLNFGAEIWHGPTGAVLAKREFGVNDQEILDAIAFHTVGSTQMSLLDQVIFIADYIEPTRDFPAVHEARKLAEESLEKTVRYIIKETIKYLIKHERLIYPKSIDTYNCWIEIELEELN